jgi:hypothetical protein
MGDLAVPVRGPSKYDLPSIVIEDFRSALARSVEADELERVFAALVSQLIRLSDAADADGPALVAQLRGLIERNGKEGRDDL